MVHPSIKYVSWKKVLKYLPPNSAFSLYVYWKYFSGQKYFGGQMNTKFDHLSPKTLLWYGSIKQAVKAAVS